MKTELIKFNENLPVIQRFVAEDTQYVLDLVPHTMDKRFSFELVFDTEGVSAEIDGLFLLKQNQFLDLTTTARHRVPHTSCITKIKGVLTSNSRAKYLGKIIIEKLAQQTSSFLEHAILVTGNETVNSSQPILEIEADDVKASHGSTTGRINEDQIYYLMSRGLNRRSAENLIIQGFFESLVSKVYDDDVKSYLMQKFPALTQ